MEDQKQVLFQTRGDLVERVEVRVTLGFLPLMSSSGAERRWTLTDQAAGWACVRWRRG